jgi:hypothetical protein
MIRGPFALGPNFASAMSTRKALPSVGLIRAVKDSWIALLMLTAPKAQDVHQRAVEKVNVCPNVMIYGWRKSALTVSRRARQPPELKIEGSFLPYNLHTFILKRSG